VDPIDFEGNRMKAMVFRLPPVPERAARLV
jgi:hypothetical protein